tara:strand:+ start:863 stop:1003 length:141 start_codon:yes stop_codon:yes gene_type:complete
MKFTHEQLKEIYSALKKGCWRDPEIKEDLIQRLENYFIQYVLEQDK